MRSKFFVAGLILFIFGLLIILIGYLDTRKFSNRTLERHLQEFVRFHRYFKFDAGDIKHWWGALLLYIITPVLVIIILLLFGGSGAECCLLPAVGTGALGFYLLYRKQWEFYKRRVFYIQCRKCGHFTMSDKAERPLTVKCGDCSYPELIDDVGIMEQRGYDLLPCRSCGKKIYKRRGKKKRFRCPHCNFRNELP
ncbi:MAG: hypothetical protein ACMUIE_05885 [Thermoplasmatota archaeon]